MLILMRKPGQSIQIGPNIVITLVSMERNRARIGVRAPREIPVDREEIAKRKQDEAQRLSRPGHDEDDAELEILAEVEISEE